MDRDRAEALLAADRERLERSLAELSPSADADQSAEDAAEHPHEDELEAGMAGDLRDELAAVERAEQRLEDGSYGLSVESGDAIPDGRLEAIPWAERTSEEQERYDAGG